MLNAHCLCPACDFCLGFGVVGFLYPCMFGVVRFLSGVLTACLRVCFQQQWSICSCTIQCDFWLSVQKVWGSCLVVANCSSWTSQRCLKYMKAFWKKNTIYVYFLVHIYFFVHKPKKLTYKCGTSSDKYLHKFRQALWKLSSLSNLWCTCLDL